MTIDLWKIQRGRGIRYKRGLRETLGRKRWEMLERQGIILEANDSMKGWQMLCGDKGVSCDRREAKLKVGSSTLHPRSERIKSGVRAKMAVWIQTKEFDLTRCLLSQGAVPDSLIGTIGTCLGPRAWRGTTGPLRYPTIFKKLLKTRRYIHRIYDSFLKLVLFIINIDQNSVYNFL